MWRGFNVATHRYLQVTLKELFWQITRNELGVNRALFNKINCVDRPRHFNHRWFVYDSSDGRCAGKAFAGLFLFASI